MTELQSVGFHAQGKRQGAKAGGDAKGGLIGALLKKLRSGIDVLSTSFVRHFVTLLRHEVQILQVRFRWSSRPEALDKCSNVRSTVLSMLGLNSLLWLNPSLGSFERLPLAFASKPRSLLGVRRQLYGQVNELSSYSSLSRSRLFWKLSTTGSFQSHLALCYKTDSYLIITMSLI